MSKRKKQPTRRRRSRWLWVGLAGTVLLVTLAVTGREVYSRAHRVPGLTIVTRPQSPFDGKRAFNDLKRVVAIGPRIAGSPESAELRKYIEGQLTQAGLTVREQAFTASTPIGKRHMVNVTGVVRGTRDGIIIIGGHYDTKYFTAFRFVGANDGGSSTEWLIEMARTLGPHRQGYTVWLCFFDGEEAFKKWSATDSLYGSRAFVKQLKSTGEVSKVRAMINIDMIGDKYLDIDRDPGAPAWLSDAVWSQAHRLGYGDYFLPMPLDVEDDHLPFRKAGIPALEVIDFDYGRNFIEQQENWHTARDTLDKTSWDSLQVVGDVIYHALPEIDAHKAAHSR